MNDKSPNKDIVDTERRYQSQGKLRIAGNDLNYQACAAWMPLLDGDEARAQVFHTSYQLRRRGRQSRPLTFVFNGGPGAASAYLHVGALGPKRLACGREGELPASPARLVDNAECWLPFTDLVFVDPVGTGLSRSRRQEQSQDKTKDDKEKPGDDTFYWDVGKDLDALCEFIGAFLTREGRWSSPIYIAGESYGGYRVARLARQLQQQAGIGLSGALLISPVLEWDALFASRFNALAAAIRLPSYAAAARRHGRCAASAPRETLEKFLVRAEQFALTEYLPAIASPGQLAAPVLESLSHWLGVPPEQLRRDDGMPSITSFVRELLRDQRKIVGLYDAGLAVDDPFPNSPAFRGIDPTLDGLNRLYTVAANQHLRDNLGVDAQRRYELLSYEVNRKWQWRDAKNEDPMPAGATEDLALGMSLNPDMRLAVYHGAYDLVTPYMDSRYLLDQLARGSRRAADVALRIYEGGHMFYMWERSRKQFTRDAAALYR